MANIYISLGTNIDRDQYLEQGLNALELVFGPLVVSSLYISEAVGFDGDEFYNLAVFAATNHSLESVSTILRDIEYKNGRSIDATKYSSRTLDLDLLLYNNEITTSPVKLPRDEITKNAFVLWPLSEIAPELHHPVLKDSFQSLWERFDKNKQKLSQQPLPWSSKL